jgi:hypothetical protein
MRLHICRVLSVVLVCGLAGTSLTQESTDLAAPEGLAVAQLEYGAEGTVILTWENPQAYERVEVSVDGESLAMAASGTDSSIRVLAPTGERTFGVRGLQGEVASEWTTATFEVLRTSPLPQPVSNVDCELYPFEGGKLIVRWSTGQDPWTSGTLEIPRWKQAVTIEAGATEASINVPPESSVSGELYVARLTFFNADNYASPAFMPLCTPRVPAFRRGDCDGSGRVNITDPIYELLHLFKGGVRWFCDDACDANDDGVINISDPIATLQYLFAGAGPLPTPGPLTCGVDPTEDLLGGLCACQ